MSEGAEFAPEQELRLAVVLYGGVSLAIYMYGIAQELYNLVRATAPSRSYADGQDPPTDLAFPSSKSTESVYRELGCLLPLDGVADDDGKVRTRFVVDIVSGTSAGGINGICLAKALANEANLSALKDVWVKEGDIGALVNDEESGYYDPPPESLLSGRRMLDKLVGAIAAMTPTRDEPSRLVDELDLWVTATDLEGLEVPIQIANAVPTERRHANRYHFRFVAADGRNDLEGASDGFVAYAARSTSAFPFAFEPVLLDHLEGLTPVPDDAWSRFYSAYPSSSRPPFQRRAFSDGGILDNKPFSYATQSLVGRYAATPVQRKLIYIEPAPAHASGPPPRERWNAIDTTRAALLGIPQAETIREDIQAVLARNRAIERVRDVVADLGSAPAERAKLRAVADEPRSEAWANLSLAETGAGGERGPAYGVYHRLKVRAVVDYLAGLVVRAAGFDPDSDEAFAVHYLVRAWKESAYAESSDGERASENAFLLEFDVPYRYRRLDFVLGRVKELQSDDPERVAAVLQAAGQASAGAPGAERQATLAALKRSLSDVRRELSRAEYALVQPRGELAAALAELGIGRPDLIEVLNNPSDAAMLEAARARLQQSPFEDVAQLIRTRLGAAAAAARERIDAELGPSADGSPDAPDAALRTALRFAYDAFEAYDLPLYLAQFGTPIGETNPVDIVRISPLEASGPENAERDLKGMRLHHFGAFLAESWRRNDIVWGRLDGAECLIKALLPEDHPRRKDLIEDAHRRILEEYRRELGELGELGTDEPDVIDWFAAHQVDPDPPQEATSRALNRGAIVLTRLAEAAIQEGGTGGAALRKAVEELRAGLMEQDDERVVAGVSDVAWQLPLVRKARLGWWLLLAVAAGLVVLGGGWRLVGCGLLGVELTLALLALGARLGIRSLVRKQLRAARTAVYRMFFRNARRRRA